MARNHARIHVTIWQDDDFLALRPSVQRLYLFLLSQANLSHLGVLPLTLRRWVRSCAAYSLDDLQADLDELVEAEFVVVDEDAEEVLVRSLLRRDGIYKQPNVMRAAVSSAASVHSDEIKRALLAEVKRIDLADVAEGKREEASSLLRDLAAALAVPERKTPPNPPRRDPDTPSDGFGIPPSHAHAQPLVLSPTPTPSSREVRPTRSDAPPSGFAEFWDAYPRHVGKKGAARSYALAVKQGTSPAELLAGAKRYAEQVAESDPMFTAHPQTWLNQGRWEDEPPPASTGRFGRRPVGDGRASFTKEEYEAPGPFDRRAPGGAA